MDLSKNLYRPRVLVVEDDQELNALEREFLSVHGLDSVAAYTGQEALEVMQAAHRIDAALLDIMLPGMDGIETCKQLRQLAGEGLPIVIFTALDSDECRCLGFEAGARAYFTKPFDPDEVVRKIQELVSRS